MDFQGKHKVSFKSRPIPIFPSYRPMYRIAQILMVLKLNCFNGRASLLKLHLFSWALKSKSNLELLNNSVKNQDDLFIDYFGIEPTLNRALDYALAERLVGFDGVKYYITTTGSAFIDKVINDTDVFTSEKIALREVGKKVTDTTLSKIEKRWKNA